MSVVKKASSPVDDKTEVEHREQQADSMKREENTFEVDHEDLPAGYFTSPFFLGTMTGIGLGLMAGVAGYGYAAPILTIINNYIGPDNNSGWVALSYTLTSAVTLTIIGRVTDIFGRRWVFVGGAALGIIGSIVCATAQSVNTLIGGTTIVGIAAATQLSYYYVMGELVPMKYRLAGNAACYFFTIPGSGVAPVIAHAFLKYYPSVGWRGCYYILLAINVASFLCWFFFYHPPTFHMKQGESASLVSFIKDFDYVGTILYTGGLLILMMGLNWGGNAYAWGDAPVTGTIVAGCTGLIAFVLWESFAKLKEPLVPMHLFRNGPWMAATILSGLGASCYYALAICWPSMIAKLYTDMDEMTAAWYASFVGFFVIMGQIVGGFVAKPIGQLKWQCVVTVLISGIFYGCTATSTPDTKTRAAVFVALGTFFIGWAESLAITIVTMTAWDQNNLGSASGLAGSIRFFITCIASTTYNAVLTNRLAETVPKRVTPALVQSGLPNSSIAAFLTALSTGTGYSDIPGITDKIIVAGEWANKLANAEAYRTIFYVSIAFSSVALICALLLPDVDNMLTGKVASTLHRGRQTKKKNGDA